MARISVKYHFPWRLSQYLNTCEPREPFQSHEPKRHPSRYANQPSPPPQPPKWRIGVLQGGRHQWRVAFRAPCKVSASSSLFSTRPGARRRCAFVSHHGMQMIGLPITVTDQRPAVWTQPMAFGCFFFVFFLDIFFLHCLARPFSLHKDGHTETVARC